MTDIATPPIGTPAATAPVDKVKLVLHASWMAIALGITMQFVALALVRVPSMAVFVRDLAQKMSWSAIVCLGVTAGSAVASGRPAVGGVAALLAAPLAFVVAKSTSKSVSTALDIGGGAAMPQALFWSLVFAKAFQYACFGAALAWIANKARGTFGVHVAIGAAAGAIFGALIVVLTSGLSNPSPQGAKLLALCANELLFPVGCAAVVYAANFVAKKAK